jgi:alpha-tubulin suppressor-like RCC1 family protein
MAYVWGFHRGHDVQNVQVRAATHDTRLVPGGFGFCGVVTAGQLHISGGTGHVADAVVPAEAVGAAVRAAACGWEHALVATEDGLLAWGWNAHGQAAPGGAELALPTRVPGVQATVRQLAAGEQHSLALLASGLAFSWGAGSHGQLGHGGRADAAAPRRIDSLQDVTAIAAGARHSLVVLADGGGVAAFGWGLYGQCGNGGNEDVLLAARIAALAGLRCVGVAAGLAHSMALTDGADCYAFGHNDCGQLGVGADEPCALTPQLLEAPVLERGVQRVCCGARHTVFWLADGALAATGWNAHGQLCTGDKTDAWTPTLVKLPRPVRDVQCGWWHTLLLLADADA